MYPSLRVYQPSLRVYQAFGMQEYIRCLSQARENIQGCVRKGVRHKNGGLMEARALIVRMGWHPSGMLEHSPLLSSPAPSKTRTTMDTIRYDTTILMCAQKPTDASLIYGTEPITKTSKMKKLKNKRICSEERNGEHNK